MGEPVGVNFRVNGDRTGKPAARKIDSVDQILLNALPAATPHPRSRRLPHGDLVPRQVARRKQFTPVMSGLVANGRVANPNAPLTKKVVTSKRAVAFGASFTFWSALPALLSAFSHSAIVIVAVLGVTGVIKDVTTKDVAAPKPSKPLSVSLVRDVPAAGPEAAAAAALPPAAPTDAAVLAAPAAAENRSERSDRDRARTPESDGEASREAGCRREAGGGCEASCLARRGRPHSDDHVRQFEQHSFHADERFFRRRTCRAAGRGRGSSSCRGSGSR